MKKIVLLLLAIVSIQNCFSQDTWANNTLSGNRMYTEKTVTLGDGRTFIMSRYWYSGNSRWDAHAAIYNTDGSLDNNLSAVVRNNGNAGSSAGGSEKMHDAALMSGNKVVMVGATNNGNDAIVFSMDGTGSMSMDWGRVLKDGSGTDITDFHAVTSTYDNNIVVAGLYKQGTDVRSLFVKWNDSNTQRIWEKTYQGLNNIEYIDIVETDDNGFIAIGKTTDFGSVAGVVVRLDVNGDLLWSKNITGPDYVIPSGITKGYNNDYLIACRTNGTGSDPTTADMTVLRMDDTGTFTDQMLMEDQNTIFSMEVVKTHSNNYALAYYCTTSPNRRGGLVSFDDNFNVLFNKYYANNADVKGVSMDYVPNDSTYTLSVNHNTQMRQYIFKTDKNGDTDCWPVKSSPLSFSSSTSLSIADLTLTVGNAIAFTVTGPYNTPVYTSEDITNTILNPSLSSISADALCIGGTHGEIDVTLTNPNTWAIYLWSSGETTQDLSGLLAGTYSIEYRDDHSCYLTDTIIISEPDSILIQPVLSKLDATCFNSTNGNAWVTVTGGYAPYTYNWNNASTSDSISNLAAATYSVTVTDSANCSAGGVIVVGAASILTHAITASDIICSGDSIGTAQISLSNGSTPYTYTWSTGGILAYDSTLFAGTHIITASDSCGTVIVDSVVITEPEALSLSVTTTDVTCNGQSNGNAEVIAAFGTGPYNYSWSNSSSISTTNMNISSTVLDTVSVTDACGATILETYIITEPDLLNANTTTTDVSCNGAGDGSATATPSGGTIPYTYLWNIGQNNPTAVGLFAGNYTVNVVDNNGCFSTSVVSVFEPLPISASFNIVGTECNENNGQIEILLMDGVLPYTYGWSNGDSTSIITGLSSGGYNVTVTDSMGCFQLFDSSQIGLIEIEVTPVEFCVITVDDQNKNSLVWPKPISNSLAGFNIYRNIAGVYNQIGFQPYDSISNFVDNSFGVDPAITSYRYKISALDSCGNESDLSSFHETIHLITTPGNNDETNLIWDDYEGFAFGYYRILRDSTATDTWEVIDSVPFTNFTYTDINTPLSGAEYAIEVVTPLTCTAEKAQDHNTTRSNRHTAVGPNSGGTSIDEINSIDYTVYPNPTDGIFTIAQGTSDESKITVQDLSGRIILSEVVNQTMTVIDISFVEKGVYLITVQQGEISKTKRIIKQ